VAEAAETVNSVLWTEVIDRGDPRADSPQMQQAIAKEVHGLVSRGTFKLVLLEDTRGKSIVPSKFVFAIKHEDGREVYKARLCLGGRRDFLKHHMVHTASTLTMTSVRLILAIAAICGWNVWTTEVQQAYLQSTSLLKKEVFLQTNAIELGTNEFLQLSLPLYGLSESEDYLGETLANHHLHHLRFAQSDIDFSLFFKIYGSRLVGLSGCYVDDLWRAAPPDVRELLENNIREAFDCKPSTEVMADQKATQLIGLDLEREVDTFFASMSTYIARLQHLSPNTCFEEYRSLRTKLLWICNARPDICVSLCSSVTVATFSTKDVRAFNNQVSYLQSTNDIRLQFSQLDFATLHLLVYTDASFGIRPEKSSQAGYIGLLADYSKKCCFLAYHSSKTRRVARSSMSAETLASADGFDCAFTLRAELNLLLRQHIPLLMFTDSAGLFDTITRHSRTSDGRLMLDIYAVRESYRNREMDKIALIRSQHNVADAMTKISGNESLINSNSPKGPPCRPIRSGPNRALSAPRMNKFIHKSRLRYFSHSFVLTFAAVRGVIVKSRVQLLLSSTVMS
jgi:hypothetical protein